MESENAFNQISDAKIDLFTATCVKSKNSFGTTLFYYEADAGHPGKCQQLSLSLRAE